MEWWTSRSDMNWDGIVTIPDVWLWFKWIYFLPGDGALWLIMQNQGLARFFQLSQGSYELPPKFRLPGVVV